MEDNNTPEDGIGSRNVHLQITELKVLKNDEQYLQSGITFESEFSNIEHQESSVAGPLSQVVGAPEKKLTLFSLRLAVLEKSATGLGTLGFIWATVVLLGGFAITIDKTDFWFITFILLFEATRIFSRSHELEWQQKATGSEIDGDGVSVRLVKSRSNSIWRDLKHIFIPISPGRKRSKNDKKLTVTTRRWESSEVPILPYAPWVSLAKNISKVLQILQISAAIASVVLSLMKLIMRNYGDIQKGDTDKRNRKAALTIFYSLALAEASLFLLEKAYWQYKVTWCKILETVNNECDLGPSGIVSVRRFFYDAYSKCVDGSIFDGLKMDMVSFAMELLGSDSPDEQLMGTRILRSFAMNERFSDDTLKKICTTFSAVERMIEMLNWKDPQEEEMRVSAAEILAKLAGKKQNSLRVAGIPGAMESISTLLNASGVEERKNTTMIVNNLGLLILQKLARHHENCEKIRNARDLIPKLIDFTRAEEGVLNNDNVKAPQIQMVKRSLQVVKRLASTTGATGEGLRRDISENVFTISNIRDILRHGQKHTLVQKLGIDILTCLAMEYDATDKIEGTGGILKELLNIFLKDDVRVSVPDELVQVRTAAGEALVMLALESKECCHRVLKLGAMEKLVKALEDDLVCVYAAGILRNLCTYSPQDCFQELKGITIALPTVLKGIISKEREESQEAMVGLAASALKLMTCKESCTMFELAEVREQELAMALVEILKKHQNPTAKFPRIRRFAIQLAIWMMRDHKNIHIFKSLRLENELQNVLDTTSEIESFNILTGPTGLSRFKTSMQSLVQTALDSLQNSKN